jgi:hypothetical protein
MKINATMSVSEFRQLVKEKFNSEIEVYTSKNNVAGENRKIKALCTKENTEWPVEINTNSIQDLISMLKRKLGLSISEIENNSKNIKSTKLKDVEVKRFTIKISGRISKYYFGKLKESILKEINLAITISKSSEEVTDPMVFNGEINNTQDFLQFFLCNTLENAIQDRQNFRKRVSMKDLEELCPQLYEIFIDIENENWNHFQLYEALFDTIPFKEKSLQSGFISFFEPDAKIQILDSANNIILEEMTLNDFSSTALEVYPPEAKVDKELNAIKTVKKLSKKIKKDFSLEYDEENVISLNKNNSIFLSSSIITVNKEFTDEREKSVTIEHDDFIDYLFTIEDDQFSFEKLVFISYSSSQDFRESSLPTVFNYMFYDDKLIIPEEKWYRDKGITLNYENNYQDINFLLYS